MSNITESQLKNALNAYFKCEAGDGLASIRAAIESLGIEVIPDPKTITINGVEVPGPERVAPEIGTEYHVIDLVLGSLRQAWNNDSADSKYLDRGLLYLNREACLTATDTILNALRKQP